MANTTKKIVETHVGKDVANIISEYTKYNYCYVCSKKKAYFPYMNYNKDLKIHYCLTRTGFYESVLLELFRNKLDSYVSV